MPTFALPRATLRPSPVPRPFGRITLACGTGRGPTEVRIASATCAAEPVCALVIAVYGSEPW